MRLEIDTATSSFLDREGPEWAFYQESLAQFGGDEFISVVIEGPTPFEPETLNAVFRISEQLEDVEHVRRIDSISTVPIITSDAKGMLRLEAALAERVESEAVAKQVADLVRRDTLAPGVLVSGDERAFAINVLLDGDVDGPRDATVEAVVRIVGDSGAWVSGVPVFRSEVNTRTGYEIATYGPLTLILIAFVILIAFRRLHAAGVALASAGIGTWVALGTMGATGASISLSTVTLPPIMLALGCAYVMHILVAARGLGEWRELEAAVVRVSYPIALSGLTTSIGFLAMATVPINAIRELGVYGSLGVVVVLAASLTFAPAILRLRPLGIGAVELDLWLRRSFRQRLVTFVFTHRRIVTVAWVAVGVVFGAGSTLIKVDTDIIRWFPLDSETRRAYELIRNRLSGITPINVVVEAKAGRVVTNPLALEQIDRLATHLQSLPEVGRAVSVVDPLKQIHREFSGEQDGEIPTSRELVEQYLGLLGSADHLHDFISDDRQVANILVRADVNGSSQLAKLAEDIEEWWRLRGADGYEIGVTGIMHEFGRAEEAIAYGQIRGLGLAFLAIAVILFSLLHSLRDVAAALIPNVLPLTVSYGLMGFLGIPLDAATVCVGSIALGIAVDDTIHVAVGYRGGLLSGMRGDVALHTAMGQALPPLLLTTVAIAIGFFALGISEFTLIRNFGVVTGSIVVLCLAADLTLLPALLTWPHRGR